MLQQITDEVDVVGQHTSLVLGLRSFRVGRLTSSPCLHYQDELSCIVLASSPFAVMAEQGSVLPHLHLQGLLYCVARHDVGTTLPSAAADKGRGQLFHLPQALMGVEAAGRSSLPHPCHHMTEE